MVPKKTPTRFYCVLGVRLRTMPAISMASYAAVMASLWAGSVFSASRGDILKKRVSKTPGSSMKHPYLTRLVFLAYPDAS